MERCSGFLAEGGSGYSHSSPASRSLSNGVTSIFLFLLFCKSNFLTSKKLSPCFYHLKFTSDDEHDRFLIPHISCSFAVEKGSLGVGVGSILTKINALLCPGVMCTVCSFLTQRHKQSPSPPKGRCLLIPSLPSPHRDWRR